MQGTTPVPPQVAHSRRPSRSMASCQQGAATSDGAGRWGQPARGLSARGAAKQGEAARLAAAAAKPWLTFSACSVNPTQAAARAKPRRLVRPWRAENPPPPAAAAAPKAVVAPKADVTGLAARRLAGVARSAWGVWPPSAGRSAVLVLIADCMVPVVAHGGWGRSRAAWSWLGHPPRARQAVPTTGRYGDNRWGAGRRLDLGEWVGGPQGLAGGRACSAPFSSVTVLLLFYIPIGAGWHFHQKQRGPPQSPKMRSTPCDFRRLRGWASGPSDCCLRRNDVGTSV